MQLSLKGFSQLVEDMGAALQSSSSTIVDVSVGSVVRAIFEANASVVLWLQWLLLNVLQTTRAATSNGPDLDSWMADFSFQRLPATASVGIVTFSRYTNSVAATIPVGTTVKTTDGSVSFSVTADQTLPIWQATSASYVLPSGVSAANLPVACTTAGCTGNVLAGAITVISSSLPGVDQVVNSAPISGGLNAESDAAFRQRFQGYLASLSRATLGAVRSAINAVQQGLHIEIAENTDDNGNSQPGSFLVVIDDGTGYPPSSLLASVASAIEPVRPIGTRFSVVAPQVVSVGVSLTVTLPASASSVTAIQLIQSSVAGYLDGLPIGRTASVTRVAQYAYAASASVENITNVQLNGGLADVVPPPRSVVKVGQVQVTVNER